MWTSSYRKPAAEEGVDVEMLEMFNKTISSAIIHTAHVRKPRKRVLLVVVIGLCTLVVVLVPLILIVCLPTPGKKAIVVK